MKAILVLFDSLNRRFLPPYGAEGVHAPNFQRLAEHSVTFDNCYVGSMPCMPARRELHTGRYNFLHRSWGPIEPFDVSMPELLRQHGIYTHLVSDHFHYWEDGGASYHNRYSTWEGVRGQEGDLWKGEVRDPDIPNTLHTNRAGARNWRQDWVNRRYMSDEKSHPQHLTFELGLEFLRRNAGEDSWFLQIEAFDPHEPFFAPQKYRDLYPHEYDGPHFDWPDYDQVRQSPLEVQHMRFEYAALVSMCDAHLGKVLDLMDEHDLWKDTLLIVGTDHGFLLGEHDWWGKNIQPFYDEIAHTPLFIWDPRSGRRSERCASLAQMIDLPVTLLEYFDVDRPAEMQGVSLREALASGAPTREAALFGMLGGHINVTDGRYVYMRAPVSPNNTPLYEYTLMPAHMNKLFGVEEMRGAEMTGPLPFTQGCPVMRIPARGSSGPHSFGTLLFDLENDPKQKLPLNDPALEKRMVAHLLRLMRENDAPGEQYVRVGLPVPG
ncbi:MAG: sulfatase [Anaerolineaceae bacterium]|nr:sulfatase [Anaerolineaceae bacterium]